MNKTALSIIIIIVVLVAGFFIFRHKGAETGFTDNQQKVYEKILADGKLKIVTTKEGTGAESKIGDSVTVNYTGKLENGTTFDSNVDPKFQHVQPFSFTLGQGRVIQGWELGVLGMKVGEKRTLTIASDLAYGDGGQGPIPPKATLIFDVEVTAIN